jgi:hypothetical protein
MSTLNRMPDALRSAVSLGNWRGESGEAKVSQLSKYVTLVRLVGQAEQAAAPIIFRSLEQAFAAGHSLDVFWDLEKLINYHSDVRTESTRVLLTHRPQLHSMHTYSISKLVSMGVSVANLALGGIIRMHKGRATFDAAVQEACLRSGE